METGAASGAGAGAGAAKVKAENKVWSCRANVRRMMVTGNGNDGSRDGPGRRRVRRVTGHQDRGQQLKGIAKTHEENISNTTLVDVYLISSSSAGAEVSMAAGTSTPQSS